MSNALGAWGLRVFQGVVDTEFLVLGKCERMVGEYFDLLDVAQSLDKFTCAFQVLVVVADAGHEHVADPDGLADFVEVTEHVQVVIDGVARQFLVLCRVDNLDVDEQQVGGLHESFEFAEERFITNKVYARRVDAGVDSRRLGRLEEFDEEIHLHQGLAAAHGDAAVFPPVALVAESLFRRSSAEMSKASLPLKSQVSGLWQKRQRMGQPCVNTTKRTPGPSTEPKVSSLLMRPSIALFHFSRKVKKRARFAQWRLPECEKNSLFGLVLTFVGAIWA